MGWRRVGNGQNAARLALLAAFAHFHRDVGDEEHTEKAPGDDLKHGGHAVSPAAKLNTASIGWFSSIP